MRPGLLRRRCLTYYYVLRRLVDRSYARSVIQACLSFCSILPVRHQSLRSASAYTSGDFEDRVLVATAESFGLDGIVTRNVDHFEGAGISVYTPHAFLLRLSELPQLWNVLKGDMSLVGPRPALQPEYEHFESWHRRKLSVKPGLTCLWQVRGRSKIRDFDEGVRKKAKSRK